MRFSSSPDDCGTQGATALAGAESEPTGSRGALLEGAAAARLAARRRCIGSERVGMHLVSAASAMGCR
jgi:hypothetical protein